MSLIWTCPSCGWRQPADRPRICGRYGEPCPGPHPAENSPGVGAVGDQGNPATDALGITSHPLEEK